MKAARLENKGVVSYVEMPTPDPATGEVLLRVKAVSICGSDIKRYVDGHRTYPMVLGHEAAGIIEKVGPGVSEDLVGKHAAVIPLVPCFECEECQRGYYSACRSYSFIGSRSNGSMADYLVLPERNAIIVPDNLAFETVAMIEPSTVARHALDLGGFEKGQTAVVFGAGSIGLLVVQWLRILGAKTIISVDIVDENLTFARKLGAHVTINSRGEDVVARVMEVTGNGVDVTLEVTGAPQVLPLTIPVTRPRGKVVFVGNQPVDQSISLNFFEQLERRELSLNGCFMSYSAPFPGHEWTDSVDAFSKGELDMGTMISHRFALSEAPEVFAKIGAREIKFRKIMLFPEEK